MTPEQGAVFIMPFGKHRGKALNDVPLDYLDWLLDSQTLYPETRNAIKAYLEQPEIARELDDKLHDKAADFERRFLDD